MIVYRELSSLCHDLNFTAKALYTASNSVEKHYHRVEMTKPDGDIRILHVPDVFMKSIQKSIERNLLVHEEISPYATAYRIGGSTIANAGLHVGAAVVMKTDIRKFFDHITFAMVKEKVFPADRYSEANRILLTILCIYQDAIPQGAPTSPAISNIILRDFDNRIGSWCEERDIAYTRYCDDMTFSGEFDPKELYSYVRSELFHEGFFLNTKKTVVLRNGQKKEVTGIVVNEKLSVPSSYKKKLRQEIYYCRKFGIAGHMKRNGIEGTEEGYRAKLLGRVNYVLSVEPENMEVREYKKWLK